MASWPVVSNGNASSLREIGDCVVKVRCSIYEPENNGGVTGIVFGRPPNYTSNRRQMGHFALFCSVIPMCSGNKDILRGDVTKEALRRCFLCSEDSLSKSRIDDIFYGIDEMTGISLLN